jgi:predicted ATPase
MIQQILEGNLQLYVSRQGGPDALLHFGRKKTGKEKNFACPLIFLFFSFHVDSGVFHITSSRNHWIAK